MTRAERIAACVHRLQSPGLNAYTLRRIEDTLGIKRPWGDHDTSEDAGKPWGQQ